MERLRDGKSFSVRSITARQNGAAIFTCTASFQKRDEYESTSALTHQDPMPLNVPSPDKLLTQRDVLLNAVSDARCTEEEKAALRRRIEAMPPFPLDLRVVDPIPRVGGRFDPREPRQVRSYGGVRAHTRRDTYITDTPVTSRRFVRFSLFGCACPRTSARRLQNRSSNAYSPLRATGACSKLPRSCVPSSPRVANAPCWRSLTSPPRLTRTK